MGAKRLQALCARLEAAARAGALAGAAALVDAATSEFERVRGALEAEASKSAA